MKIKEVKPINFIFYRTETTVSNLINLIPVAMDLFSEAVALKLHVTGPIHWHYFGFTGDIDKPFTLEIALPVATVVANYDGKLHFKRTEPFKCVSTIHEGGWLEIPSSYDKLLKFATENHLQLNLINRELYINADFQNPEANVTEIQMGVR
jgi:effector-binding domain-containing protein